MFLKNKTYNIELLIKSGIQLDGDVLSWNFILKDNIMI